jgi:hypothetical protein
VKVTPIIQKQAANCDLGKMSEVLDSFTSAMDNIQVNADVMSKLATGETYSSTDVEDGLKQLKRQILLEQDLQEEKDYKEKVVADKFKDIDSI